MKLLLASLLGVALAASSSIQLPRPFESNTEYRFRYEGVLTSGLPLQETDASITRMHSDVTLQMTDDRTAVIRLQKIRIASAHANVNEPFESLEKRVIASEHEKLLQLPVRFQYREGVVSQLQFADEEQPWTENIKRAVINMLQMNLKKTLEDERDTEANHFIVPEKTIEGDCKVAYTLVQNEKETVITKAVDFDTCTDKKFVRLGARHMTRTPEQFWTETKPVNPKTVYTYKVKEQQLKEVEVVSTYTVFLKEQPAMETEVRGLLTLVNSEPIRREIEAPKGEKKELIFSTEWEELVERFFKNGDEVQPFEKDEEKIQKIEKIIRSLAKLPEHTPESVHLLARLVRHLRMSSLSELKKVHSVICKKADEREQRIVEHALAIAGTKNCIEHLLDHIRSKDITTARAVQLLKSIQETPFPSEKIADLIQESAVSDICRRQPALRQTTWLALGSIVRGVVVPTMENHLINESTKEIKMKYISIFRKEFERSEEVYDKIIAIKTFANAGIDLSVHELEKIIYDRKQHTTVRVEAVDALRLLSRKMVRKVQRVLMPVFADRTEKPEIRMACLARIVYTMPPMPIVAQIVDIMEREPNQEVAAFSYHLLNSAAKSTHPFYRTLVANLNAAIRQTRYTPSSKYTSMFVHMPVYVEKWLSGASFNFATIFGKSFIPKDVTLNVETMFLGDWNNYFGQIGISQQNAEVLFSKVMKKVVKLESETMVRGRRLERASSLLKELARKLNIRARETTSEEAGAIVYFRYKQMDYAVLPIDEKIVDAAIEKFFNNGKFDWSALETKLPFDYTTAAYFFETIYGLPTSIGFPLEVSSMMPTLFTVKGHFELERKDMGARMNIRAQPVLASTHVHQMRFWTPLFEQGVKMIRSIESNTPIDMSLKWNFFPLEVTVSMMPPREVKTLVRVSGRPVAFLRFPHSENVFRYVEPEEKTLSLPAWEKKTQMMSIEKNIFGMLFKINGMDYTEWTLENVLFGEQQMELAVEPTRRVPEVILARLQVDYKDDVKIESPKMDKMFDYDLEIENYDDYELRDEKKRQEHIRRVARDYTRGQLINFKLFLEATEKTDADLTVECQEKWRFCRAKLTAKIPTESRRNWEMQHIAEFVLPEMPTTLKQLKEMPHREVQVYVESNWGSNEQNKLHIKLQLEQTKEQTKLVRLFTEQKKLRGMDEWKLLRQASLLNQMKASAEYKLTPESEIVFDRIFSWIKSNNWINTELIAKKEGQKNKVFVKLTAMPYNQRFINMIIQTPNQEFRVLNVEMPVSILPSFASTPRRMLKENMSVNGECRVESNRVNTFDEVVFRAPLTTCFSTLAKDCSSEHRFAVLAKKVSKRSDEKIVKIIKDNKEFEMKLENDQVKVFLNKKPVRENEFEEKNIKMISERLCEIDLENVWVRFDGYTINVELSNEFKQKQCGLCGNYDNQKDNDFRTADDYETEDIEKFHRSYLVKDEQCDMEEDRLSEKKNYKLYEDASESQEEEYDYETAKKNLKEKSSSSESQEESDRTEPELKNRIVEYSHRICFSMEPINTCPKDTKTVRSEEKKVKFTCISRNQPEARELIRELRRNPKQLDDMKVTMIENVRVPAMCEVY